MMHGVYFVLITRHANRICFPPYYFKSSLASPAVSNFSYFCRKRHDFRGKMYLTRNVCFSFLFMFYVKLSHIMEDSVRYYHKRT